jgi:hypothetical protein
LLRIGDKSSRTSKRKQILPASSAELSLRLLTILRHSRFIALRDDKKPKEVVREG